MSEETAYLAFESDIVANVDVEKAIRALAKLGTTVSALEKSIKGTLSGLQPLVNKVTQTVNTTAKLTENVTGSLEGIADQLDLYASRIDDLKQQKEGLVQVSDKEIEALRKTVRQQEDYMRTMEATNEALSARTSQLEWLTESWQRSWAEQKKAQEEERKGIGETVDAYKTLEVTLRDLVGRWTEAVVKTRAEFPKGIQATLTQGITGAVRTYEKTEGEIGKVRDKLLAGAERWAREEAEIYGRSAKDTEQIVIAWLKVFDKLIRRSVIPDLVDGMEHHLVKRMEKILGEHADLIRKHLLPKDVTSEVAAKTFKLFIDEIEKEQKRLQAGFLKEADVFGAYAQAAGKALDDLTDKEKAMVLQARVVNRTLDEMRDKVRVYRDEIAQMPTLTPLNQIAKEFARQGETIEAVTKQTDNLMFRLRKSMAEMPDELAAGFQKASATIQGVPQRIGDAIYTGIESRLRKLPLAASQNFIGMVREMNKIGNLLGDASKETVENIIRPHAGAYQEIVNAWKPLVSELGVLGKESGQALMSNVKDSIELASQEVIGVATTAATKIGDAMLDRFKYTMGSAFDILTFKGKEDRLRNKLQRALDFEMPKTWQRVRDEMNYVGVDIEDAANTTAHQMRVMRQSFGDAAGNILLSIDNIRSGTFGLRDGLSGLGTSFVQIGRVMGRGVGITESMDTVNRRFGKTLNFVTKSLSSYTRENEIADKGLSRLAKSTDSLSNDLKRQAQVLIKQQELIRQDMKARQKAVAEYILSLEALQKAEEQGVKLTEGRGQKIVVNLQASIDKLKEFGVAGEVFGDLAEDLEAIRSEVAQTGDSLDVNLSTKLRTTGKNAIAVFTAMDNELQKISGNFPKSLSMINRAIQDLEQNSKHFITTLRDGGKVSTERLQDMLQAFMDFRQEMEEAQRIGAVTPELQQYWENLRRNILMETENFALMGQRALVVQKAKEKLFGATRKVTGAIEDLGRKAARNIPIVGEKAKLTTREMERFSEATGKVRVATGALATHIGRVDPVLGEVAGGIQELGQAFGATMQGMSEAAAVKTASIAKSFTLLKIAAAGLIGIFGAVIVSTGKLAAEVTTLGMTMTTVGKNMGIPARYLEDLVQKLKDTGITTRESMTAITAWMRAGLPFEWKDATTGMSVQLKDLARSAQELAVAMGEDSSETFARFIDFIQSGNSNLLKTVGIMKTANQMYEEYAKTLGKTVKAMGIREKQEALIAGLMKETAAIQGVYTEAMKTASKQLGSMKRHIEELRLAYGKHFEPILALVIMRFNELLKILTKVPEKTKRTITTFVAVATALSGIVLSVTLLLPKFKALLATFKLLSTLLLGKFGLLLTVVGAVAAIFGKWFMGIKAEGEGIEGIVNRIDKLLESFGGLKKVLQPIMDWISDFANMVGAHFKAIGDRVSGFVENIRQKIQEFMDSHPEIASFLERAKTVLGDLFTTIWRVVDQVLGAVEALLDQDWDTFFEKLRTAGQYILTWMFEFFNEVVKRAFDWGYNVISSFISGIVQKARIALPRAMTAVGNMIASFLEGHSPAKLGPLSRIDLWGAGLMGSFERGLRRKRILFDEDMFVGLSTLNAKARLWGDNITNTFAAGIAGKAAGAVIPAMDYVGELIARFLEGHSPPIAGRLAEIEDWGRNTFETFLAGFEMADFSILDQALGLVHTRIENLVDASKDSGVQIAKAMMQVREAVAGAIFQARATGGPLDLGGLKNIMVGTLEVYAADIAAVLEAAFAAAEAQKAVQALQDQIEAARRARQDAIQAAQDNLKRIQDQIKAKEKEVEALNEQMEAEFEARAKAMGIFVDEKLMNALKRELERANVEVGRAQRRLERVRAEAGKYGMNILSWEEINAKVQLQLAKDRQDQAQEQINYQEELQRQADALRERIEEEYQGRFDALEAEMEALQKRAEAAQEHVEALRKADQAASRAEQDQLKAAQRHAKELADNAALLSKALEARMKAEEEARKAVEESAAAAEGAAPALPPGIRRVPKGPREYEWDIPPAVPEFSNIFQEWLFKMGISFEGGLPGLVAGIKEKIEEWWGKFIATPFGQWWEDIGAISGIESVAEEFGEIIDRLKNMIGRWVDFWNETLKPMFGLEGVEIGDVFNTIIRWINWLLEKGIDILSEVVQIIIDLISLDFDAMLEDMAELVGEVLDLVGIDPESFVDFFVNLGDDIRELNDDIGEAISDIIEWFEDLPGEIEKALKDLWKKITKPFEDAWKKLTGGSIVPDMIGDVIDWFTGLPGDIVDAMGNLVGEITQPFKDVWDELTGPGSIIGGMAEDITKAFGDLPGTILSFAGDFLSSAQTLGQNVYDGISGKIGEVADDIGGWMSDAGNNISDAAGTFWSKATEVASNAYNAVSGRVGDIARDIAGWFRDAADNIKDSEGTFWQKAWNAITSAFNAIRDRIVTIGDNIAQWFRDVAGRITEADGSFWQKAWMLANEIYNAIRDIFFHGDYGILPRIGGWIMAVANRITEYVTTFYDKAWQAGRGIYDGMVEGIGNLGGRIWSLFRGAYNYGLRPAFNWMLDRLQDGLNWIIDALNAAWEAIFSPPGLGFPLPRVDLPTLPMLEAGGIITHDIVAKLHAGEVVLPLDRLEGILRSLNIDLGGVPAFAPIMNFYPGSSPQQVMPAIHQAYDWYKEELRRG